MLTSGRTDLTESALLAGPAAPVSPERAGLARALLIADVAWRLGPRACGLFAWHRLRLRLGIVARRLPDRALPTGRLLPDRVQEGDLTGDTAALTATAEATIAGGWHGPFRAGAPALALDLFGPGDIRPVWEANRLLALPLLALAARIAPADGHLERAEALLSDWCAANPPFRGPAWACGQEAALRALHLCLALALLEGDRAPSPAMRALLLAHARRIEAARAYAAAQDNNHAISEPAGLVAIGLVLGHRRMARRGARGLGRTVARLVAADGSFAQASPGYHRLLLDTLALAEWFRRRHGAPPFPQPFSERARAATDWLARVMDPATGVLPRCGAMDDSRLADLTLHGPHDARGSLDRARRLFGDEGQAIASPQGARHELEPPGLRAFGSLLAAPTGNAMPAPGPWHSEGWFGHRDDRFHLLLRTGAPMRFRPGQADLLHLDLALDGAPLLIDGGTGAYNPPPDRRWWTTVLAGTAGHNTIQFDGLEQMPRLGRFLLARWPDCHRLPDGAGLRDHRGNTHRRRIRLEPGAVTVEDAVSGPFTRLVLRWRLVPGVWDLTPDGVAGPRARIALAADAPCRIRLAQGWHSPAYGRVEPAPVLELAATAPVTRLLTRIEAA